MAEPFKEYVQQAIFSICLKKSFETYSMILMISRFLFLK